MQICKYANWHCASRIFGVSYQTQMIPIDIAHTALLEIDLQNDFCPPYSSMGKPMPPGALAVASGDGAIAPLNALACAISARGGRVALSQDWHPTGHISFASSHAGKCAGELIDAGEVKAQMLWPDHCVQGTWGAQFHEKLDTKPASLIIRKGFMPALDSYSAFFENDKKTSTGLGDWLKGLGITRLIIGGLATDYCVFYSVMDALTLGFGVIVASDAVFGVDIPQGSVDSAISAMKKGGALFMGSDEILNGLANAAPQTGGLHHE